MSGLMQKNSSFVSIDRTRERELEEREKEREREKKTERKRDTERHREILKGLGSVLATFIVASFTYINRNINLIIDLDYFFVCFWLKISFVFNFWVRSPRFGYGSTLRGKLYYLSVQSSHSC